MNMNMNRAIFAGVAFIVGIGIGLKDSRTAYGICYEAAGCVQLTHPCRDCDGGPCGSKQVGVVHQSIVSTSPDQGGTNYAVPEWTTYEICLYQYNCKKNRNVQCPLTEEEGYWDCEAELVDVVYSPDDFFITNPC